METVPWVTPWLATSLVSFTFAEKTIGWITLGNDVGKTNHDCYRLIQQLRASVKIIPELIIVRHGSSSKFRTCLLIMNKK